MTRRWQPPDPIGLSVIDLLCCAFVAVYVLNLQLADTRGGDADGGRRRGHARAIIADLDAKLSPPPRVGVRLTLGPQEAWSTRQGENPKVTWSVLPYSTRAFVAGNVPVGSGVDVFLLEFPTNDLAVKVMLSFGSGQGPVANLDKGNFFRAHVALPNSP